MLLKLLKKAKLGSVTAKALTPLTRHFAPKGAAMTEAEALALLTVHSPDPGGSAFLSGKSLPSDLDLTIIVPVYNVAPYLRDCVSSVLTQETQYRFRAIFIDDGSTDESGQILDACPPDPRMQVIHQENQGLSGARNTGIAHATGTYLLFLDSDDRLAPGAVESLLSAAYAHNAALVQGCFSTFTDSGKMHRALSFPAPTVVDPPLHTLPGYAWGKLIRRDCFAHLRFPAGYWYEDSINAHILFPLLLGSRETVVGIQDIVCHYRENPQGISRVAQSKPKSLDSFWITKRLFTDREAFSLENTQFDYEMVLNMILLTYVRTQRQPQAIRQALMVQWGAFLREQFPGFHTSRSALKPLEEALNAKNFPLYSLCCQLL